MRLIDADALTNDIINMMNMETVKDYEREDMQWFLTMLDDCPTITEYGTFTRWHKYDPKVELTWPRADGCYLVVYRSNERAKNGKYDVLTHEMSLYSGKWREPNGFHVIAWAEHKLPGFINSMME